MWARVPGHCSCSGPWRSRRLPHPAGWQQVWPLGPLTLLCHCKATGEGTGPGGCTPGSRRLNVIAADSHQKVKAQQRGMAVPSCSPSFRHTCTACRQEPGASRALPPRPPTAHPASLCVPQERSPGGGSRGSRGKRQCPQRPPPPELETQCDSSVSEAPAARPEASAPREQPQAPAT